MSEEKKPGWEGKHFSFFSNRECEYFPCHKGVDPEEFNCLFCYCPLYALGEDCGGGFKILKNGVKDCSSCVRPHAPGGYEYVLSRLDRLTELMRRTENLTEDLT